MRMWFRSAQLRWLVFATGGLAAVLTNCQSDVRETVLTGAGEAGTSLAATAIAALVQYLMGEAAIDLPMV